MKYLLGNHRSLRVSNIVNSEPENGSLLFFVGSQKHYCQRPRLAAVLEFISVCRLLKPVNDFMLKLIINTQ
jgi:hypothetical protein